VLWAWLGCTVLCSAGRWLYSKAPGFVSKLSHICYLHPAPLLVGILKKVHGSHPPPPRQWVVQGGAATSSTQLGKAVLCIPSRLSAAVHNRAFPKEPYVCCGAGTAIRRPDVKPGDARTTDKHTAPASSTMLWCVNAFFEYPHVYKRSNGQSDPLWCGHQGEG